MIEVPEAVDHSLSVLLQGILLLLIVSQKPLLVIHPHHAIDGKMLGMHGTIYVNYKVDLLLPFRVWFDDWVTGKVEAFASRAKIVHIDIDPVEIRKNKLSHVSIEAFNGVVL
ncbi:Agglutinin-like protein 1 precursor [Asimina triloba]